MQFFTIITDAKAIIHSRGVYRQVDLYLRGDRVFAKHGAGFVRLNAGGTTSAPNIRWAEIDTPDGEWSEKGTFVTYTPGLVAQMEAAE